MAQAQAHTEAQADPLRHPVSPQHGNDVAYRYFTYLSPAHRAHHPTRGRAYGIEPYVMAGDVYSQPPHVGRGGWSWYTGAAAWMHRAAIESIFGLRQGAHELSFTPCLPSHWPLAELTLRRDGRSMHFVFLRAAASVVLEFTGAGREHEGATLLHPGQPLRWTALGQDTTFVVPLQDGLEPEGSAARAAAAAAT
jgi:cyclic beta-1,2-glucan synthetase